MSHSVHSKSNIKHKKRALISAVHLTKKCSCELVKSTLIHLLHIFHIGLPNIQPRTIPNTYCAISHVWLGYLLSLAVSVYSGVSRCERCECGKCGKRNILKPFFFVLYVTYKSKRFDMFYIYDESNYIQLNTNICDQTYFFIDDFQC